MAAPTKYDSPPAQLVKLAREARTEGLSFEAFWQRAIRPEQPLVMANRSAIPPHVVVWPTDTPDRKAWRTAIIEGKEAWRRAYEKLDPQPGEHALAQLRNGLNALAELADERGNLEGVALG